MTTSTAETTRWHARPRRTTVVGTAIAAVLLVAAGCGDDDATTAAGAGGDEVSIAIASPTDGDEVGRSFDVEVDAGVPLGEPDTGRHHVHLYYDGNTQEGEYDLVYDSTFTVDRLDPGEHTVEAVIANADHSLTDARDQITLTVADGATGTDDDGDSDGTDADTDATDDDAGTGYDY